MSRGLADIARLDATIQLYALSTERITAGELLEASIARAAETRNLNAVVRRDLERARDRAKAIDDRRSRGESAADVGLLAGLPMTVKDSFDVEDMPASSGKKSLLDRFADDAAAVAKIRSQGAVIWGKTNVPVMTADAQTYNRLYGTTNNPYDPSRTAGGSSGGAAAAVAAGITPLEIGSDMSGSLRLPASFCGIFAHKPTYGLVSLRGHVPPAPGTVAEPDMNVAGPMARSARDLRLLLSILTNSPLPARAPPALIFGLKVGLWVAEPAFALAPEVRTVVESLAGKLSEMGAEVKTLDHLIDLLGAAVLPVGSGAAVDARPGRPGPPAGRGAVLLGRDRAVVDRLPCRLAGGQRSPRPAGAVPAPAVRSVRRDPGPRRPGGGLSPRPCPDGRAHAEGGKPDPALPVAAGLVGPGLGVRPAVDGDPGRADAAGPAGGGAADWAPRRRFQDPGRSPGHRRTGDRVHRAGLAPERPRQDDLYHSEG
jgi:hypothetical protein